MLRVLTIFGTRPEIIRLSCIVQELDQYCDHVLCHTGQNFDPRLSEVFFGELALRAPDHHFGIVSTAFAEQVGEIMQRADKLMEAVQPDRLLILGDTNSALAAFPAARRRIPVYHLEAGNRCYDDRVPEEINRRVVDHLSAVLMPYTQRSKENLVREGIDRQRIFVIGNPIYEVLERHKEEVLRSSILTRLRLDPGQYFTATLHRAENVDDVARLSALWDGLDRIGREYGLPVIVPLHPRTQDRLNRANVAATSNVVRVVEPLGFHDFVHLEQRCKCMLTDSGTVQEECAIFHVPNVTLRDVTERPETIESGSNLLSGASPDRIADAVRVALGSSVNWEVPSEYVASGVAARVTKVVLGYDSSDRHRVR